MAALADSRYASDNPELRTSIGKQMMQAVMVGHCGSSSEFELKIIEIIRYIYVQSECRGIDDFQSRTARNRGLAMTAKAVDAKTRRDDFRR